MRQAFLFSFAWMIFLLGSSIAQAEWIALPSMTVPRYDGMAAVDSQGNLYVFGGADNLEYLDTAEMYDGNNWSGIASLPTPFALGDAAFLDGKIFITGGFDGSQITTTTLIYDVVSDAWSTEKEGLSPRYGYSLEVLDDRLYRIGGADETDKAQVDCWILDGSPVSIAALNQARKQHGSAVYEGYIYVFGGIDDSEPTPYHLASVEIYDSLTDSWHQGDDLPVTFWGGSSGATDGSVWACHGIQDGEPSADCHVYSGSSKGWETINAASQPRYRVFSVGFPLVALGGLQLTGQGAQTTAIVEQWIPDGDDDDDTDDDDDDDDTPPDDDDNDDAADDDDDAAPSETSKEKDDKDEGCCG